MSEEAEKNLQSTPDVLLSQNTTNYTYSHDEENPSVAAQLAAMSPEKYQEAEKKLIRKMDMKLIPWMT
jgi:hypothetical protein